MNLFAIREDLRPIYLEQLKLGIQDFEKNNNYNFQNIELETENSSVNDYRKFFSQRKILILDTNLSYFRITTTVKVIIKNMVYMILS